MKNLLLLLFLGISFNVSSQVSIGESINDGRVVEFSTGKDLCTDNSLRVEVDVKNSKVKIVNFGEVRDFDIVSIEYRKDREYFYSICISKIFGVISVSKTHYGISVYYPDNNIQAFAEVIQQE